MITQKIRSITIIGAGNVAFQMADWFQSKGYLIDSIWNRTFSNALKLAKLVESKAVLNLNDISKNSDLYLLCIKDDALPDVILDFSDLGIKSKIICHTSGSTPITIFEPYFKNYGSLYPLQTFTKGKWVDAAEVPFFITGNSENTTEKLGMLAQTLSPKCFVISDQQRKMIHLSAVFACNFTNHMYCLAQKLLSDHQISFEILHPLIKETLQKALENNPCEVQTGPAERNDKKIIEKHLELLKENKELQDVYATLSNSILNSK
jgi:predicted short-subunit dehydrogenase-like oxidoreductase (DUF2520 family)